ncbi:MAG TPA: hypothetical protein VNH40_13345, partial [Gaiellaceae bacterium]|nr:hypothetical protein [Gaiellaceae bacterium]
CTACLRPSRRSASPPIEQGPDRSVLDPLLREVAGAGVFVSARPDVILKIATKRVLVDTAQMSWSAETHRDVERRWRTNRKRARWARFRLATIRRTRERGRAGSAATLSRAGLS